jgi:hypothetical protein
MPPAKPPAIPVMFRKWPNGIVIAILPEEAPSSDPQFCVAVSMAGQGSVPVENYLKYTVPASPAEYAALLGWMKDHPMHSGLRYRVLRDLPPDAWEQREAKIAERRNK